MRSFLSGAATLLAIAVLSLVTSPFGAVAQIQSGTISGTVVDSSGGAVVNAHVTITSDQTGATRPATTNEAGIFTVTALPPGAYSVTVYASGFTKVQRTGLALSADERLDVGRVELSVGAVAETVTVTSQGAVVQDRKSVV